MSAVRWREHAVTRYAERTGADPGDRWRAWRQRVYAGHTQLPIKGKQQTVYGYRWRNWVFVVRFRQGR